MNPNYLLVVLYGIKGLTGSPDISGQIKYLPFIGYPASTIRSVIKPVYICF